MYLPYKKDYKKDTANYRPMSLLNLHYKIYTSSYESNAKKHLATIIGENQSGDITSRINLLYTLFLLFVT